MGQSVPSEDLIRMTLLRPHWRKRGVIRGIVCRRFNSYFSMPTHRRATFFAIFCDAV
jgi:hypothetical protein